ncbi:FliA/WhiG family RNA polymerase sigma factor [Sphingobacteriales bacterium CHB3]|nr:FliA/WhiG family RNA polymerase sigma factor [Sphingobacteriales bacterium CHB3]
MNTAMNETATETLWEEYSRTRSLDVKRKLVTEYSGVVKFVVSKFRGYSRQSTAVINEEDLLQLGMIGLLDSIDRFDPSRGVKFETYAITRIRGTVQDELRKLDWVPRSVREKVRTLDKVTQKIECNNTLAGSTKHIAEELQMSVDEYIHMLHETRSATPEAITFGAGTEESLENSIADDDIDPAERMGNEQVKEMLVTIVENLPSQDRLVIALYYYEELTFKEIANVLRLSESRVFQKHAAILERLRNKVSTLVS